MGGSDYVSFQTDRLGLAANKAEAALKIILIFLERDLSLLFTFPVSNYFFRWSYGVVLYEIFTLGKSSGILHQGEVDELSVFNKKGYSREDF